MPAYFCSRALCSLSYSLSFSSYSSWRFLRYKTRLCNSGWSILRAVIGSPSSPISPMIISPCRLWIFGGKTNRYLPWILRPPIINHLPMSRGFTSVWTAIELLSQICFQTYFAEFQLRMFRLSFSILHVFCLKLPCPVEFGRRWIFTDYMSKSNWKMLCIMTFNIFMFSRILNGIGNLRK